MATSAFGNIVVASQVEYAVRDVLQLSFPAYLREVERQVEWEGETLPTPRNYTNRNSYDALSGEELPKVVIISPGLWAIPEHIESDGYYTAIWQVGVGIATAARDEETADKASKMYAAAARTILLQNQSLNGYAAGVYYLDENYDDLPIEEQHMNLKSAGVFVGVKVEEVTNRFMHPDLSEASQTIPEVDTTIIQIPEWDHEIINTTP